MWFLRRQPAPEWWAAVADYEHAAPGIIRELLRSTSVVCDRTEALQALAWARAHPCWRDDEPALEVLDTIGEGAGIQVGRHHPGAVHQRASAESGQTVARGLGGRAP